MTVHRYNKRELVKPQKSRYKATNKPTFSPLQTYVAKPQKRKRKVVVIKEIKFDDGV